jgi:hypothetical protein
MGEWGSFAAGAVRAHFVFTLFAEIASVRRPHTPRHVAPRSK